MRRLLLRPAVVWTLAAVLIATTAAFMLLQFRWVDRAARAQAFQAGARLEQATKNFVDDFDRELLRAMVCFAPRPGNRGDAADLWRRTALDPDLVVGVESVDFADQTPPRLVLDARSLGDDPPGSVRPPFLVLPDPRPPPGRRFRMRTPRSERDDEEILVVRLSAEALQEFWEKLARRHFSFGGSIDFHVVVRESEREVFRTGPDLRGRSDGDGDARAEIFTRVEPEVVRSLLSEIGTELEPQERMRLFGPPDGDRGRDLWRRALGAVGRDTGAIEVVVTHPEGSLARALKQARRRNQSLSLVVLTLFSGALVLLVVAARRSQRLAERQLDFVAGVTHELLTPLAAMRSAGQNLADGVVRDEAKVRQYGALVEREGRRLSDLVRQVLDFAGMQSGRVYAKDPVDLSATLRSALAGWRGLLDEAGFEVRVDIEDGLSVSGDVAALERTFGNLFGNALKYASGGLFLGLAARADGAFVQVEVEDRGPGIAADDLPHLFEPFYRGKGHAASALPGSGLGLALAHHVCEQHGGRLDVRSTREGSVFTVRLPRNQEPT